MSPAGIVLRAVIPLLLLLRTAVAPTPAVRRVPVMTAGASAVGCLSPGPCKYAAFRIPGLINTVNETLIAVAEGRKTGCGDFAGAHDLVASRSTDGEWATAVCASQVDCGFETAAIYSRPFSATAVHRRSFNPGLAADLLCD